MRRIPTNNQPTIPVLLRDIVAHIPRRLPVRLADLEANPQLVGHLLVGLLLVRGKEVFAGGLAHVDAPVLAGHLGAVHEEVLVEIVVHPCRQR